MITERMIFSSVYGKSRTQLHILDSETIKFQYILFTQYAYTCITYAIAMN